MIVRGSKYRFPCHTPIHLVAYCVGDSCERRPCIWVMKRTAVAVLLRFTVPGCWPADDSLHKRRLQKHSEVISNVRNIEKYRVLTSWVWTWQLQAEASEVWAEDCRVTLNLTVQEPSSLRCSVFIVMTWPYFECRERICPAWNTGCCCFSYCTCLCCLLSQSQPNPKPWHYIGNIL